MKLRAEHHFAATPEEVAAAMVDPDFAVGLVALTDVGDVEVVGSGHDDSTRWLAVRIIYDGSFDPVAARILGSSTPSWIQTYHLRSDGSSGTLTINPERHESLLRCESTLALRADGGGAHRLLDGEISVRVPLVGPRAEKALVPAILARIDGEAELLRGWLSRSR